MYNRDLYNQDLKIKNWPNYITNFIDSLVNFSNIEISFKIFILTVRNKSIWT